MNTKRFPYQAPERKHDVYPIRELAEHEIDGLRVYCSAAPVTGTITAFPNLASAEAALGPKNVRAAVLWELIRDNPGAEIVVKVSGQ